jgi:hypothetical protein
MLASDISGWARLVHPSHISSTCKHSMRSVALMQLKRLITMQLPLLAQHGLQGDKHVYFIFPSLESLSRFIVKSFFSSSVHISKVNMALGGYLPPVVYAVAAAIICPVIVAVYRRFFHPLNHVPGPTIAAITHLYKLYYNATGGSKFYLQIEKLHHIYGKHLALDRPNSHTNPSSLGHRTSCQDKPR